MSVRKIHKKYPEAVQIINLSYLYERDKSKISPPACFCASLGQSVLELDILSYIDRALTYSQKFLSSLLLFIVKKEMGAGGNHHLFICKRNTCTSKD